MNEKTGEMSYGFASNLRDALPNASFIVFTGTPIEKMDANTRAVFGDYISIYDIQRAVADKATGAEGDRQTRSLTEQDLRWDSQPTMQGADHADAQRASVIVQS